MRSPFRLITLACLFAMAPAWGQGKSARSYSDNFHLNNELNKAAAVMLVEEGVLPRPLASKIAAGLVQVIADGNKPGAKRPSDYLQYEPLLIAQAGPDASRIHSGRSRQDIIPTNRRIMLRERTLELQSAMLKAREQVLKVAEQHLDTIVPGYTNGVQAQPTTYGHYLLAFAHSLERNSERLNQAWPRLNRSPLGSAVFGTSSFPLNRERLATLLGFEGAIVNSYDATQLSTFDTSAELVGVASLTAIATGSLVSDIHTQYHQAVPWLLIQEGRNTHTSSIMPQKRNPTILNNLRLQASTVVGDSQTYLIQAHNVTPGMPDHKREQAQKTLEGAITLMEQLTSLFESLVVNKTRALEEVNAEYSTTTELADVLQREADVPFRIGHHFASDLVTLGRNRGAVPSTLTMKDVETAWESTRKQFPDAAARFPLTEKRFRESLSPAGMLAASKGLGGPQPGETRRMLAESRKRLAADMAALTGIRDRLQAAQNDLDQAFRKIAGS